MAGSALIGGIGYGTYNLVGGYKSTLSGYATSMGAGGMMGGLSYGVSAGMWSSQVAAGTAVKGAGKVKFDSLDDFVNNPKKLGEATPEQLYKHLQENGFNSSPLSGGNTKGIPFKQGGGFKVNWGGDRILQYHPAGLHHHGGGAYSSGPTGTLRFDLNGNLLP